MNENEYEWVSASSLAVQLNVSTQTIYNRIKRGDYPAMKFERGKNNGVLVGVKKQKTT